MLSLIAVLCLHILVVGVYQAVAAEATLEQLVAGAKGRRSHPDRQRIDIWREERICRTGGSV